MAHIDHYVSDVEESNRRGFGELEQEAAAEAEGEEDAEVLSAEHLVVLLVVEEQQNQSEDDVADSLI